MAKVNKNNKKMTSKKGGVALQAKLSKKTIARKKTSKITKTEAAKKQKYVTTFVAAASDASRDNLSKFDHIVVLMLENRSFDHMLGYLSLEAGRTDIDGLSANISNSANGKKYKIWHLDRTAFTEKEDPCHDGHCVSDQLRNNNGGFVSNYMAEFPGAPDPSIVMGYYNAKDLPVYDHLAREFTVCNRWFSSVDGATWPNRLYSITGRADKKDFKKENKTPPIYDIPSFPRHLDERGISWRWYCHHKFPTLRLVDGEYRIGNFANFGYFDRQTLTGRPSFLEDAASGNLPAVSWIDPSFVNAPFIGVDNSNDDHPPSDIRNGQELVLKLYNAISNGPKWNKTLLVITYDEHGGFFDHVGVPSAPDDRPKFRSYGVRVPTFVVSPFVSRTSVSNMLFDHTSIIKTILLKFCSQPDGSIPDMGTRVTNANHLGSLLTLSTARKPPTMQKAINAMAAWKQEAFKASLGMQAAGQILPPSPPNELQRGLIKARKKIEAEGFPSDEV